MMRRHVKMNTNNSLWILSQRIKKSNRKVRKSSIILVKLLEKILIYTQDTMILY
jgi:hypothetical protein